MDSATPSHYLVTARKWRPQRFDQVVGQDHITTTLRNALRSGRVHQAYLFCGPRGVGKTTTARILARAVNCATPIDGVEPCNQCPSCLEILSGRSLDVIEIDGASNNSVEDVRRIRDNAKYLPTQGKYRVYIIDEVHMLSTSAFNALLKTLEEPPPHLLFIFATTEPHKVPPTIQSRCQRFDFHRMETRTIAEHLRIIARAEGVDIDDDALFVIARWADGSMRDAQSLFDQVCAFSDGTITGATVRQSLHLLDDSVYFAITDAICERNLARVFELAHTIVSQGYDVQFVLEGLLEHLRNVLTVIATGSTELIDAASETQERYRELAQHFRESDVLQMMTIVATAEQQLRYATNPRLRLELLLATLVELPSTQDIATLIEELRALRNVQNAPSIAAPSPQLATATQRSAPSAVQHSEPRTLATPPTPPPTPQAPAARSSFDWQSFVATLPKGLELIKPLLAELPPPRWEGNVLVLECRDAAASDAISLKRKQLEKALAKHVRHEVEVQIRTSAAASPPAVQPSPQPAAQAPGEELSPLERAIIEKLGGKRVPLIE